MVSRHVQKESAGSAAPLGEARHGALEGVTVQIGIAGTTMAWRSSPAAAWIGLDFGDRCAVDGNSNILRPAIWQKRL